MSPQEQSNKLERQSLKRQRLIDLLERNLGDSARDIQEAFDEAVQDLFRTKVKTTGGKIDRLTSNVNLSVEIEKIWNGIVAQMIIPLQLEIAAGVDQIIDALKDYYSVMFDNPQTSIDRARNRVYKTLGIRENEIMPNGLIGNLSSNSRAPEVVKSNLMSAILGGYTVLEGVRMMSRIIRGHKNMRTGKRTAGVFEKNLEESLPELFPTVERLGNEEVRKNLGLKSAIYQGGLMETSRAFCIARDNKIYTEEQIKAWANLTWEGKSDPYNPFLDLGGYNCRHMLDWISEELAGYLSKDSGAGVSSKSLEAEA